jgi:hypothetical protein
VGMRGGMQAEDSLIGRPPSPQCTSEEEGMVLSLQGGSQETLSN